MDHSKSAVSFLVFHQLVCIHRLFKVMWVILVFAILSVRYRIDGHVILHTTVLPIDVVIRWYKLD